MNILPFLRGACQTILSGIMRLAKVCEKNGDNLTKKKEKNLFSLQFIFSFSSSSKRINSFKSA
ncbi:MAG: hypothetical protein ACI4WD_04425, partial [Lactococcus garvieae]